MATLSLELRTLLHVIAGYTELLKTADRDSAEFTEAVAAIERKTSVEVKLISDTLDVSRIITGKMTFDMTQFDFDNVVESALESIKFSAEAKRIRVHTDLNSKVERFFGDETRIRQLVWNLLSNAVKFTPPDGHITIRSRAIEQTIEFRVSDTGKEIDSANLGHVFEHFWQEESGFNRTHGGLGLGLAIVRHIAELHGGTASVMSQGVGLGTTFMVHLPIQVPNVHQPDKPPRIAADVPTSTTQPLKDIRLLVMDDSADSLVILARLLRRLGALPTVVSSSREGLKEAETGDYQVIISDIGMPYLDGYELMRRLRTWERAHGRTPVPSIALTAHVNMTDARAAHESGYQLHLPKPVDLKALETAVLSLLKR